MRSFSAFICSLLVFSLTSSSGKAQEQENVVELQEIVVTSTRTEVPLEETAGSVTVIYGEELEDKGVRTVLDGLREVPGLDIVQSGGPGGVTSAFLRGTNSDHALILIDGVQVNSPSSGLFDFSNLTLENIERIEIIRGAQSTLYGSDAIGGVIHIVTKQGSGSGSGWISQEIGSYQTFREGIGISGKIKPLDYSVSASRIDTKGFSRASEEKGNLENDAYENLTLSSNLGLSFLNNHRVGLTARYSESEQELDGCGVPCPMDDPNSEGLSTQLASSLNYAGSMSNFWSQALSLSFSYDELSGEDPDTPFNNFKIETQGRRLDWRHDLDFGDVNILSLGYEYESLSADNVNQFEKSIVNNAVYLMNQFRMISLIVNGGFRFDDNNRFGNESTYKAEAAYLINGTGTKFRTAYGTGFHAPTINDLYFPGFGNPNLDPERSRSFEAGFDQNIADKGKVGAVFFRTDIEDLIIFVFDPLTFIGMAENVEDAEIKGVEVTFDLTPNQYINLRSNYTLTDAKNKDRDLRLARRPRHKAGGTLTLIPVQDLRVSFDLRYTGERFSDTSNSVPLRDYLVVHLSSRYQISSRVEVYGRVENLFDREYEEIAGFQTPGLSGYGGIKVSF